MNVRVLVQTGPASTDPPGPVAWKGSDGRFASLRAGRWYAGRAPHEAIAVVPATPLEARPLRAAPRDDQPGLLAARSADLPSRHRRVRDPLPRVHDRRVLPRRQPAARARPSAWRSSRAWRRTSRTTSSTSSRSASAPSSTPTGSGIRSSSPTRSSRTSGAARRWASSRRSAPTSRRLISAAINVALHALVGVIFVMVYAFTRPLGDRPGLSSPRCPLLGFLSSRAEPEDQDDPEDDRRRDDGARRIDDRVAAQHRARQEPRTRRQQEIDRLNATTGKILQLELKKVRYLRSLSFIQGTVGQLPADQHPVPDALPHLRAADHGRAVLLAVHLFVLHLRPAAGAREHHQHLPRDGGLAGRTSRTSSTHPREPRPRDPVPLGRAATLAFEQSRSSISRRRRRPCSDISFECAAARRSRSSARRAPARRRSSSCWSACTARSRGVSSTTGARHDRSTSTSLREQIGFVTQDTQLFSGTIRENLLFVQPGGDGRGVPRRPAEGGVRQPAGPRRPRPRHRDRRGRREGVGRREAAAVHRTGAAPQARPPRLRRSHVVARLADRGGDHATRSARWRATARP